MYHTFMQDQLINIALHDPVFYYNNYIYKFRFFNGFMDIVIPIKAVDIQIYIPIIAAHLQRYTHLDNALAVLQKNSPQYIAEPPY